MENKKTDQQILEQLHREQEYWTSDPDSMGHRKAEQILEQLYREQRKLDRIRSEVSGWLAAGNEPSLVLDIILQITQQPDAY